MSRKFGKRKMTGLVAFAIAAVLGVSAYAFTASNTLPTNLNAGAGTAALAGYTVSNVSYTWDPTGSNVVGITFDVDAPASDVAIALTAAAPVQADWLDCGAAVGASAPYAVSCDYAAGFEPYGAIPRATAFPVAAGVANAAGLNLAVAGVEDGLVTIHA